MCIDICPVGALTSGAYRYQTRPWEMEHVGTICAHCSNGCKTTLGVRNGEIVRGNNRDSSGINGEFLCVKGRYAFDFTTNPERLQSPMMRKAGRLEEVSWSEALGAVAGKFREVRERGGKIGVIGSNHTTNEENYYLQKFARQVLQTNHLDHQRTGAVVELVDALAGKTGALAGTEDLYRSKAVLVIGSDLSQQHPMFAYQIRANFRHHQAHVYTVTEGPVREHSFAVKSATAAPDSVFETLELFREQLKGESELVVLFGDCIHGASVRRLVEYGDSLGIPVKYVCLVDYSNSRGASDMGLLPDVGPGYEALPAAGMTLSEMVSASDLDVLWAIGSDPLGDAELSSTGAFVVVQDMFLTNTARRADVVFPSASAYEKSGTVTNACGEVQKLKPAAKAMGTKSDLEIIGLIGKEMGQTVGIWSPDKVFDEIRRSVHGYNVALPVVAAGGAGHTAPLNGRVGRRGGSSPVRSARDTLFTSGTNGRYSKILRSVMEAPGSLYRSS